MCRKSKKHWTEYIKIAVAVIMTSLFFPMEGGAAEATDIPLATISGNTIIASDVSSVETEERGDVLEAIRGDTISVDLPAVSEETSPFDFFLDPGGLLYETDAMRYGGGSVQEGATMLFRNRDGKYDFSGDSDKLEITNRGDMPVILTISASINDLDGIDVIDRDNLSGNGNTSIYLALIDDRGEEQPLSEDMKAEIRMELDPGVYSFGLTGACSIDADWQKIDVHPRVTVTWNVEPLLAEEKAPDKEVNDKSNEDITEQKPVQEDVQNPPVEEETSAQGKENGMDGSDSESESNESEGIEGESWKANPPAEGEDIQDQGNTGDISGNRLPEDGTTDQEFESDSAENPTEDTISIDGSENGSSESQEKEEKSKNFFETVGIQENRDVIENEISHNVGMDLNEKKESVSENVIYN